jgi:hypothetical protein
MEFSSDSEDDHEVGIVERYHQERNLETNQRLLANLKKYTDMSDAEVDEYA